MEALFAYVMEQPTGAHVDEAYAMIDALIAADEQRAAEGAMLMQAENILRNLGDDASLGAAALSARGADALWTYLKAPIRTGFTQSKCARRWAGARHPPKPRRRRESDAGMMKEPGQPMRAARDGRKAVRPRRPRRPFR